MTGSIKPGSQGRLRPLAPGVFPVATGAECSAAAGRWPCPAVGNGRGDRQPGRVHSPDYADLFERAPVGYLLLDATGCIDRINGTGAAILGWGRSWLVGKPFSRWVANNDKQLFHCHRQALRHTRRGTSQALRVKNRQGRWVSLRLESEAETDANGVFSGCRCIMIDISGEEQSARQLRQLQSQLAHVARVHMAGELASSLAHELNQPLGTVVLNCETALRLLNSGDGRDYEFAEALAQATEAASYASDIVRHLRDFLRHSDEHHRVCALPAIIRDVTTLIATDARDNDIELELDIAEDMANVRVDPVQIEQVLVNLTHNGIEAMCGSLNGGAGRLTIAAQAISQDRIQISVRDTGPGLTPEQMDRVFGPFYTTKRKGMGMGLSISRSIVEAHGGQLWAAAEAGGASMLFTLPTIERLADSG